MKIAAPKARVVPGHFSPLIKTMDLPPSRTADIRLHRVTADNIESTRGVRARLAGIRLD